MFHDKLARKPYCFVVFPQALLLIYIIFKYLHPRLQLDQVVGYEFLLNLQASELGIYYVPFLVDPLLYGLKFTLVTLRS